MAPGPCILNKVSAKQVVSSATSPESNTALLVVLPQIMANEVLLYGLSSLHTTTDPQEIVY